MKTRIYILVIVTIILAVLVGACRKAGSWLVKEDRPEHADAVVMLMGNIAADRVLQTADLYSQQVAGKVVVVEEGMGALRVLEERGVHLISNTSQAVHALAGLGIPADSIVILPGDATSTVMEAEIIRDYLASVPDIDTVIVVSSAPHMRRASMIFSAVFKSLEDPVSVYSTPSSYTDFNAEKWWRNKEDIQQVVLEYLKIGNFLLSEKKALRRKRLYTNNQLTKTNAML